MLPGTLAPGRLRHGVAGAHVRTRCQFLCHHVRVNDVSVLVQQALHNVNYLFVEQVIAEAVGEEQRQVPTLDRELVAQAALSRVPRTIVHHICLQLLWYARQLEREIPAVLLLARPPHDAPPAAASFLVAAAPQQHEARVAQAGDVQGRPHEARHHGRGRAEGLRLKFCRCDGLARGDTGGPQNCLHELHELCGICSCIHAVLGVLGHSTNSICNTNCR
mmetsp:Transcript_171081/g.548251  ORF Transcript_171081/g.548251 Transcript_171081/m.548251 type:complete len:219 (+) Transcript_171081:370-1026(+)